MQSIMLRKPSEYGESNTLYKGRWKIYKHLTFPVGYDTKYRAGNIKPDSCVKRNSTMVENCTVAYMLAFILSLH